MWGKSSVQGSKCGGGGNNVLIDNFSAELPTSPLEININAQRGREDEKIFFLHILPCQPHAKQEREEPKAADRWGGGNHTFISSQRAGSYDVIGGYWLGLGAKEKRFRLPLGFSMAGR